jgi:hypothetical protein
MRGWQGRYIAALGVAAAVAVGATTVAVGQGTGGTLGPKAQGTATFQVRIAERSMGLHCSNTNNARRCREQRDLTLGSLIAGRAVVFQGDRRVGTAHFANLRTQRGRDAGGDIFLSTMVLNDGTLTLQGATVGSGRSSAIPSSITGGSGAYAGARGYVTESDPGVTRGEFRVTLTVTFIP